MSVRIDLALELHQRASELEEAGDGAAAENLCRQALAIFEEEEGDSSPDVANLSCQLGAILEKRGDYGGATQCSRRAIAIVEPLLAAFEGPDGVLILLHALGLLGTALRQQGLYREAAAPLERAIELAESMPDLPAEAANAWNNLGMVCKYAGWFDRGEAAYRHALRWAERCGGEDTLLTATILHNVGGLEHARERFAQAEEPARRAWETRRAVLGDGHPDVLADAVAYAAVLDGLDRYDESRPIYERALAAYEARFGPCHYEVASTLHNLAALEEAVGNLERAAELCRLAWQMKRTLLGDEHPDTALTALVLASILLGQGHSPEARELARQAEDVFARRLSPDHPHLAQARHLLTQIS
jgi:tetratricopeptide (TPR) repeat protein